MLAEEISPDQKARILDLDESHFLDLKSIDIRPGKLTEVISAFANSAGGELYIGIEETVGGRVWRGFENQEAANGHLQIVDK